MLANSVIALCVSVAILKLGDLFLSESQKDRLSNAVTRIWDTLDETKHWSPVDWLRNPRAKWWLAISVALCYGTSSVFLLYEPDDSGIPETIFIAILILFVARPILARLLNFSSGKQLWYRLAIAVFCLVVLYSVHETLSSHFPYAPGDSATSVFIRAVLILLLLPLIAAFVCVCAVLVSLAAAYLASIILFVLEFIARRIAEYPKGPILALSTFFGCIAALFKAFG